MKYCPLCKKTKPFDEFHRNLKWGDGYQVYCKPCRKQYDHDYYERTDQKSNEKRRERRRLFRRERAEWLRSLKMRPCTDCGGSFAPEGMEWDHLPGAEKLGTISAAMRGRSVQAILDEIGKCDLVCAVCHAIRTRRRLLGERTTPEVKETKGTYKTEAAMGLLVLSGWRDSNPRNLPVPNRTLYQAELHPVNV